MKPKGVIFDFNGVIVDDYPLQKEAWNQMSIKLRNKEVTDEEMLQKIRGVQTKETIRWMTREPRNEEELALIAKEKNDYVKKLCATSPLFCLNKGLDIFFNDLKSHNIPRTIATSSDFNDMKFSFDKLGLPEWFDINLIVYNNGTLKSKPAPDAYILAAKKINLDPKFCVVFEDAASGITAAFNAGVQNIVAVGAEERLSVLKKLPGVVKGIHDFSEITVKEIFFQ